MINNIELKAKPGQTLYGHLTDSLSIMEYIQGSRGCILEYVVSRLKYDTSLISKLLGLMVYAHDLGKSTPRWQNYLETGKQRITHSLFSVLILKETLGKELSRAPEGMAVLLAVLAHHGMLHEKSFSGENITGMGEQDIPVKEVNKLLQRFNSNYGLNLQYIESGSYSGAEGAKIVSGLRSSVQNLEPGEKIRFKGMYSLLLALLQLCDNEASYQAEKQGESKLFDSVVGEYTGLRYVTNPAEAFSAFKESGPGTCPNNLQNAVLKSQSSYLVLQAGCGSGKTAAALHYTASLAQKGAVDRCIITLPTRFTTNSIYWDFQSHYGLSKEHTGIYHGEMESVLLSAVENDSNETDRHIRDLKFENSFFNRTINVCTVDHLLYSLLHCHKYADRAFGNLITSAVIFDEIHFYDAYTLQKIGQCMQLLRELGVPHLIMSATIPESIINLLNEDAKQDGIKYDLIRQNEVIKEEEDKPFKIVKMSGPVMSDGDISRELFSLIEDNIFLRQMVIVNQVEKAKEVFRAIQQKWPGINVICYHSEFTRRDRDQKERVIRALFKPAAERGLEEKELLTNRGIVDNDQVILVSTQVCEMSLDISTDVMYSEIAPADAVAQRGGRLHRKGSMWRAGDCACEQCKRLPENYEYLMYLFPIDWEDKKAHLPYKDKENNVSLLEKSWEIIGEVYSFSNVVEWVNKLYPESPDLEDEKMQDMILEDAVFGRKPVERFGDEYSEESGGSFRVRRSEVISITVVPGNFIPDKDYDPTAIIKDCGVRVSVNNKLQKHKDCWLVQEVYKEGEKYKVHILNLPYSWEFGFDFKN